MRTPQRVIHRTSVGVGSADRAGGIGRRGTSPSRLWLSASRLATSTGFLPRRIVSHQQFSDSHIVASCPSVLTGKEGCGVGASAGQAFPDRRGGTHDHACHKAGGRHEKDRDRKHVCKIIVKLSFVI
jgi:hypothetical protein